MQNRIKEKLHSAFDLEYLKLENESFRHNVPPGSESHFKAVLVSRAFTGLMPVKRHRMVYGVLSEELQAGVHALALHTYTPAEWEEVQRRYPNSPDCLGGGGK